MLAVRLCGKGTCRKAIVIAVAFLLIAVMMPLFGSAVSRGHCSIGVTQAASAWYLAEGHTGQGFDTWVLVQNPGDEQALVTLEFQLPPGESADPVSFELPARSRKSICLNSLAGLSATDVSTRVTADKPVIAERAMYFDYRGMRGGHCSIGVTLSPGLGDLTGGGNGGQEEEPSGEQEVPEPDNLPPAAVMDMPHAGKAGEEITCDASKSSDPDGEIVLCTWDFGDGETAEGEPVCHEYKNASQYEVILTVTDDGGATAVDRRNILIEEADVEIPEGYAFRNDLGAEPRSESATGARQLELADIFHMSDVHIVDEDSPLRVRFLDPLGPPFTSAYRPHEHLSARALDAMVNKINDMHASEKSPFNPGPFDLVMVTGDGIDNCQRNELRWFMDIMDGNPVDPSSDDHPDLALDPEGLLEEIPWYSAVGNHDIMVQGNFPPNLVNLLFGLNLIAGDVEVLDLSEFISEYFHTTTSPQGHGFNLSANLNDGYYAFDPRPGLRFVVLNTANDDWLAQATGEIGNVVPSLDFILGYLSRITEGTLGGVANGELDPRQFYWMVEDIEANRGKLVVVFAHHATDSFMDPVMASRVEKALRDSPNVIAYVAGHSHTHKVEPEGSGMNGYWKIKTASLADMPSEGRAIEVVDDGDGTGSIVLTCVQHDDEEYLETAASDPQADPGSAGTEIDRNVILKFAIPPAAARTIRGAYGTPGPADPEDGLSNPVSPDDYVEVARHRGSYLAENSAGKKLLYLEGDAYQRGYAEGNLCPEGVYRMTHEFVDTLIFEAIGIPFSGSDLPLVWGVVKGLLIQAAAANQDAVPKEFRLEMQGIADGARERGFDVSYEELLTLNLGFDTLESIYLGLASLFACNQFAAFGGATEDGRLYHGRDFMFPTGGDVFADEALMVVQKPDEGHAFVASAAPGFVGIPTGLNARGVSCGMDVVYSVFTRPAITGAGCLLLSRWVVQFASSMQEGIDIIAQADRAVPWLYMIADGKQPGASVLETAASTIAPPGDVFMDNIVRLVPGLAVLMEGADGLLPAGLVDGTGSVVGGAGELLESLLNLLPGISEMRPDRGLTVRPSDWMDPEGIELFGLQYLPDEAGGPVVERFPRQQESYPDLVAMTNHYITPQMAASNPALFSIHLDETKDRYETLIGLLHGSYGEIDRREAMWLIDFLNPARCEYYGTDTTQSVKGHHVLMDNHSLEMWSLHGYYDQAWQHVDLPAVLEQAAQYLNKPPAADAGPDREVTVREEVRLDGRGSSDPDGDPLAFSWSMPCVPEGSEALLDDPSSPTPAFTPDKPGEYEINLVVSDGRAEGVPDTVRITALPPQLSNPVSPDDYRVVGSYGASYLAVNSSGKGLLYLEGDAYQRGYAEGYLCPEGVYRMSRDYVDNFIAGFAGLPEGDFLLRLLAPMVRSVLRQAVRSQEYAVPEEYRLEMRGIADGARDRGYDVSYSDVLLINVGFDFLYSLVYQAGSLLCNEYSAFGEGTSDGRLYHGRDFMFSTGGDVFSDEALIMVHVPTRGYPLITSAVPGFVGFPTGMNSQGVSFGMDMVPNRQNRAVVSGMGCLLLCRDVVQRAGSMQEGIEIVRNTSRGVSWLFMIADGKIPDAAVLETVADRMIPEGDHLLSTLSGLLPGLSGILSGVEEMTGVSILDAAGDIITTLGDLLLGGASVLPVLGDAHPDRGVAVRASDYVDPEGIERYRIAIDMRDPLVPIAESTVISPFPMQREREPGVVAMTNHYILPQMNLTQMGLFYHTIDTMQGGGRESEWRYDTMLDLILRHYGGIDSNTAMWLIDFLNPARCEFYGTDTSQSVKGHHVLMDNRSLEMWSLHGYYDQPWQHVDLGEILAGN